MIGSILLVLVAILSQLMFVTAFVPLNVDILSHELSHFEDEIPFVLVSPTTYVCRLF